MENFISMFRYFWTKIFVTIPICFFAFEQSDIEVVWGIVFIVILDTILGILVGLKYKRFSSHRLSRLARKIGNYGLAMASVWVLSAVEKSYFGFVFHYVGYFIIVTEVISNFEKLSLLGFRIPTKFLAKLNKDFEKFYDIKNKEEKDKMAEKIIDNRDCKL